MTEPPRAVPTPGRMLLGCLAGIAAAALVFVAAECALALASGAAALMLLVAFFDLVPAAAAATAAIFPCLAADFLAGRRGIRSRWWFVLLAAAAGLTGGVVVFAKLSGRSLGPWQDLSGPGPMTPGYARFLLANGLLFTLSGVAGGLAYWQVSRGPTTRTQWSAGS